MTINDIPLTQCDIEIHKHELELKKLMRDGEKQKLREAYKAIFAASFHAIERMDRLGL